MWETILGGGLAATLVITIEKFIEFLIMHFGKKKSTTEMALRALLRERIRYLCRVHIAAGQISYADREDLITMHQVYHDEMGGNGNLEPEMSAIMGLKCI